jgi:hypothetical protein
MSIVKSLSTNVRNPIIDTIKHNAISIAWFGGMPFLFWFPYFFICTLHNCFICNGSSISCFRCKIKDGIFFLKLIYRHITLTSRVVCLSISLVRKTQFIVLNTYFSCVKWYQIFNTSLSIIFFFFFVNYNAQLSIVLPTIHLDSFNDILLYFHFIHILSLQLILAQQVRY